MAGDRVFSLILSPEGFRDLRGLCLFIIRMFWNIGKEIRSNTLSPAMQRKSISLLIIIYTFLNQAERESRGLSKIDNYRVFVTFGEAGAAQAVSPYLLRKA
jgi:hypothetical protein